MLARNRAEPILCRGVSSRISGSQWTLNLCITGPDPIGLTAAERYDMFER